MTRMTKALMSIAGIAALGGTSLVLSARWPLPASSTTSWGDRVAGGSEAEGMESIRSIAALADDIGIPLLVEALGSEHVLIANEAGRVLMSKVDAWELLSPELAARRIEQLADCLAQGVNDLGLASRGLASDLALRILLWPQDHAALDWASLLAKCETVVRAYPGSQDALADRTAERRNAEPQIHRPREWLRHPQEAPRNAATAPGGGSPEEIEVPPLPPMSDEKAVPTETADAAVPEAAIADHSPRQFIPPDSAVAATAASEEAETAPQEPTSQPAEAATATFNSSIPDAPKLQDYRGVETLVVMQGLHTADATAAARAELERRGFGRLELELARRLTDPDPAVRRDLAEKLPRLAAVDAKPWLLWFSRDADAGVRQVAVSLMGTTNDAEMLARITELGSTDPGAHDTD